MKRRLIAVGTLLLVLSLMVPQCAFSQPGEGIKYGNWKLHPFGGVQEQFDSNIFLDSTGEKKDWITSLSAGFDAEGILAGDISVKGGYSLAYNLFANYSKQSALNQYGNLALQHEFKDVTVKVNDVFQHVYDRPDTETTQRVLWDKNDLGVIASAEYNRFGWSLEYRDIMYNYETEGWQSENRWDNNANAIATYRIFTKTYLLAEFNYGNINYCSDTNSDANFYQGLVGIKGKLTAKLTGTVKAGWQYRDYTRSTQKDYDSPVTMAGLLEQFTDRDTLSIDWIRSPYESLYTGTNYYVDNSIKLKYKHKFTEKLTGNLGGLYRLSQYPTETVSGGTWKKRLDNTWSVGAGAEYAMQKWLTCKAGYDFIQRKSNFGTFDYNDNLATISVNARY